MNTVLYSTDAEREILSSIIRDATLLPEVVESLKSTDFFIPLNQLIFSKIATLYTAGHDINVISVYESLGPDKDKVSITDLASISEFSASPNGALTFIKILIDFSQKRKIMAICEHAMKDVENHPADRIADALVDNIYNITNGKARQAVLNDEESMGKTLKYIELAFTSKGESVGLKTGYSVLDKAVGGFERGSLSIIAGRPSMGKSAFALELMNRLGKRGFRSMIFELEMSHEALGVRRIATKTLIPVQRIRSGNITDEEFGKLTQAADKIAKDDKILTDTTPSITLIEIRSRVRMAAQQGKAVDVVFVDHIGLMSAESAENRNLEISKITAGFRALAKEFQVAVILLWQLNRGVESRTDKRPLLSDLRDSGSAEQDADVVMFCYRDGYYSRDTDIHEADMQELEVIIGKNRNGKSGTIYFEYSLKTQSINERSYQ